MRYNIKNLLFILFFVSGLSLNALAQQKDNCQSKADVLLSKSKPSVYLSFDGVDQRALYPAKLAETDTSSEQERERSKGKTVSQIVRLRLHNNTRWAISVFTDSLYVGSKTAPLPLSDGRGALGLRDGVEANIRYGVDWSPGVESKSDKKPALDRIDMYWISWLPSGHSVIFIVPREHLSEWLRVYVTFRYQWETTEKDIGGSEPEHRVYFRAVDLPKHITGK